MRFANSQCDRSLQVDPKPKGTSVQVHTESYAKPQHHCEGFCDSDQLGQKIS